jgi:general secretion pathway protein M
MSIRSWWENLQDRERRMLSVGAPVVGILVIYALIWSPLSDSVTDHKMQVASQKQLLVFLQRASRKISQLQASGISVDASVESGGLLTLVEQSLSSQQLSNYLKQVQQPTQNQIRLNFEDVPFDKLMQWLQMLITTHGIRVERFSATRLSKMGEANVQVVLK